MRKQSYVAFDVSRRVRSFSNQWRPENCRLWTQNEVIELAVDGLNEKDNAGLYKRQWNSL